jgi:hypothetical protein
LDQLLATLWVRASPASSVVAAAAVQLQQLLPLPHHQLLRLLYNSNNNSLSGLAALKLGMAKLPTQYLPHYSNSLEVFLCSLCFHCLEQNCV